MDYKVVEDIYENPGMDMNGNPAPGYRAVVSVDGKEYTLDYRETWDNGPEIGIWKGNNSNHMMIVRLPKDTPVTADVVRKFISTYDWTHIAEDVKEQNDSYVSI